MHILLVDDDSNIRSGIAHFLILKGHNITEAEDGLNALEQLSKKTFDLVITDIKMPNMSGLTLLKTIKQEQNNLPVIIVTAFATIEDAVTAMQWGANDYLTKPLNLKELQLKIDKIDKQVTLQKENAALKSQLKQFENPDMIGYSKAMQEVNTLIRQISSDDTIPVLITGESGTGKEIAAKSIHQCSSRRDKPFIAVNCAAFPEHLLESELFGYKKGTFTGAEKDKTGFFQAADNGTLFLDEISEMSITMQAKLLRALQEQRIQPLGATLPVPVNVHILSATNKNLKDLINAGLFREDLYFRLNVIEINLPPLRERHGDIPLLINHFIKKYNSQNNELRFSATAMQSLLHYNWPGNIRELENLIRRLMVTSNNNYVDENDLNLFTGNSLLQKPKASYNLTLPYKEALTQFISEFENDYLIYHLKLHRFNISKTAEAVGLSRVALHKKIKHYHITANENQ